MKDLFARIPADGPFNPLTGIARRRMFRRAAAMSAMVAGVTGIAASAFVVLYYALAQPWEPGHDGPWEWLGPASDIVGSVSMAALIPVIVYLRRRVPADRLLGVLSVLGVLASCALALAGPLLVAGAITLETQFVVTGVGLPVVFGWLWRACRAAGPRDNVTPPSGNVAGVLPSRTARFGEWVAIAALAATGPAAIGLVLPAGSVGQSVVFGLAAVPGLPAYLAFPFWPLAAGHAWWRGDHPAETAQPATKVAPGAGRDVHVREHARRRVAPRARAR